MRRKQHSERDQLELFRALPGDLAPREQRSEAVSGAFQLVRVQHEEERLTGCRRHRLALADGPEDLKRFGTVD